MNVPIVDQGIWLFCRVTQCITSVTVARPALCLGRQPHTVSICRLLGTNRRLSTAKEPIKVVSSAHQIQDKILLQQTFPKAQDGMDFLAPIVRREPQRCGDVMPKETPCAMRAAFTTNYIR